MDRHDDTAAQIWIEALIQLNQELDRAHAQLLVALDRVREVVEAEDERIN